jgi:hypothetical protein
VVCLICFCGWRGVYKRTWSSEGGALYLINTITAIYRFVFWCFEVEGAWILAAIRYPDLSNLLMYTKHSPSRVKRSFPKLCAILKKFVVTKFLLSFFLPSLLLNHSLHRPLHSYTLDLTLLLSYALLLF